VADTCFVEHEEKTFFSWLGDTRSEDGGQGRCSCAFIEAKRRPLTVAAAKGTRAKRVLKPFSLGPLFSICLRRGAQEPFLRFQMDTCVNGACAKLLISRMLTFADIWSALGRSPVTRLGMTCQRSSAAQAARTTRHPRHQARSWLQTRVHRLAFERQNRKRAFMHTAERLPFDESLQGFDAERELA
jgi:hypothetical protein